MRILIVKISALGDVVHSLSVLAYIKKLRPEAEIDWLVEEGLAPLLEGFRPVIIWGNDEERQATKLIAAASNGRAVIWPRASLQDLVALLQRADLLVGGDTGPAHIAEVLQSPPSPSFALPMLSATDPEKRSMSVCRRPC